MVLPATVGWGKPLVLVPGTKLKPAGSTKLTVCALTELVFGLVSVMV